jgi:hypothetical protein
MKHLARLGYILLALAAVGSRPVIADHPEGATTADLRELRTEVNRLDDNLQALDESDPRTREFREREQQLRDRLVSLRDQMRDHQQDPSQGFGASKSAVADLRGDIQGLSRDIEAAQDRADRAHARGRAMDLPDGTEIRIRLEEPVSSRTSRVEERVDATVVQSVTRDGRTAIPAGTAVRGSVSRVERAQRPSKGGRVEMSFDSLVMDGQQVGMDARVVNVNESGIDKKKAGLGAVIGGVLGAVLDGGKGAVIGAIVGGGGAVVASSGDDVELPAGTVLTVELERPLTLARR